VHATPLLDDEATVPFPEVAALFLLIVPVVGWVIGIVIAWRSAIWDRRAKLAATVLGPGGLPTFVSAVLLSVTHARGKTSTAGSGEAVAIAVAACIVVASFASIVYLGVRLRRAPQTMAVEWPSQ
jgi:uncharacterized membrane protein